jgi:hypothetical protein
MGDKDCTLALNFGKNDSFSAFLQFKKTSVCKTCFLTFTGGTSDDEENVPAKIYEQVIIRKRFGGVVYAGHQYKI